jgi:hypothetical protein
MIRTLSMAALLVCGGAALATSAIIPAPARTREAPAPAPAAPAAFATAEIVSKTPEQLRAAATHIVTGQVLGVYTRTQTQGNYERTDCIAEVRVTASEKGDGIAPDQLVYARYWHRRWIGGGPPPPGTNGFRGMPSENDTVRIYLNRDGNDGFGGSYPKGGFNVVGPNGFEKLTAPPADKK